MSPDERPSLGKKLRQKAQSFSFRLQLLVISVVLLQALVFGVLLYFPFSASIKEINQQSTQLFEEQAKYLLANEVASRSTLLESQLKHTEHMLSMASHTLETLFSADAPPSSVTTVVQRLNSDLAPFIKKITLEPITDSSYQIALLHPGFFRWWGASIELPVSNSSQKTHVLKATLSLEELTAQFVNTRRIYGNYTFITNEDWGLISAPPNATASLRSGISTSTNDTSINLQQVDHPLLRQALQNMVLGRRSVEQIHIHGHDWYLAYQPIPASPWRIGLMAPKELISSSAWEMTNEIRKKQKETVFMLLVTTVVMVSAVLFIATRLARQLSFPISAISRATRRLATGHQQDPLAIQRKDELGRLAKDFNKMSARIKRLVSDLNQRIEASQETEIALKNSQNRLLLRSHQLQAIMDNSPALISIKDLSGRYQLVNNRFCQVFKHPLHFVVGKRDDELFSPELAKQLCIHDNKVRLGKQVPDYEESWEIDQQDMTFLIVKTPLFDELRQVNAILTQLTNISVRKQVEINLSEQKKLLESSVGHLTQELQQEKSKASAAIRTKNQFLASVSHELRTPLSAILGYTQLLLQRSDANEEVKKPLHSIQDASEQLLKLINDVLDFARLEASDISLQATQTSLSLFLSQLRQSVDSMLSNNALHFVVETDDSLPDSLYLDPDRLRQVLLNLIHNAIKYTEQGEITLSIKLLKGEVNHILFEVKDTGTGLKHDDIKFIFQPFMRGSDTKPSQGIGLGLSICRDLVKLMGGELKVITHFGKGTQFYFTLPMAEQYSHSKEALPPQINQNTHDHSPPQIEQDKATPFSQEQLEILLHLARSGRLSAMQAKLHTLTKDNSEISEMAEKLLKLAKNYQTKAIVNYIQELMAEEFK